MEYNDEIYTYTINNERYCFRYPNPKLTSNGKGYSEVAIVWKENDKEHIFTVPFYVKYEEIGRTHEAIIKGIEERIESK